MCNRAVPEMTIQKRGNCPRRRNLFLTAMATLLLAAFPAAAAEKTLSRAWALFSESGEAPSQAEWERSLREFRERVMELQQRIKIYNLKAPAAVFQRKHIDPEKIVESVKRNANG